ncbi:MAG: hypothetical protein IJ291_06405 [Lachnospiraceae bacterium]|nr:hypothetical protein [Lachnospiraceae bacterium]
MFRIWIKEVKDNKPIKDTVIENAGDDTRTHKIFHALEKACHEFDIENPIWLDVNISEFKRFAKTRFTQDSFIEEINFDYLEMQIIEED